MGVLLEFGSFYLLIFEFIACLIRIRVLLEGGSLSRIYGSQALPQWRRSESASGSLMKLGSVTGSGFQNAG